MRYAILFFIAVTAAILGFPQTANAVECTGGSGWDFYDTCGAKTGDWITCDAATETYVYTWVGGFCPPGSGENYSDTMWYWGKCSTDCTAPVATPTPVECSSYPDCPSCAGDDRCEWVKTTGDLTFCEDESFICPASIKEKYWTPACNDNVCAPTPTPTRTPTPTPPPCIAAGNVCIPTFPCDPGYEPSGLSCGGSGVCCQVAAPTPTRTPTPTPTLPAGTPTPTRTPTPTPTGAPTPTPTRTPTPTPTLPAGTPTPPVNACTAAGGVCIPMFPCDPGYESSDLNCGGSGVCCQIIAPTPTSIALPIGVPIGGFGTGTANKILTVFIGFLMAIAVLFFLYTIIMGGMNIIASQGDKKKFQTGRDRIAFAVVGLIIIFMSVFLISLAGTFLGTGLIGGPPPGASPTPPPGLYPVQGIVWNDDNNNEFIDGAETVRPGNSVQVQDLDGPAQYLDTTSDIGFYQTTPIFPEGHFIRVTLQNVPVGCSVNPGNPSNGHSRAPYLSLDFGVYCPPLAPTPTSSPPPAMSCADGSTCSRGDLDGDGRLDQCIRCPPGARPEDCEFYADFCSDSLTQTTRTCSATCFCIMSSISCPAGQTCGPPFPETCRP